MTAAKSSWSTPYDSSQVVLVNFIVFLHHCYQWLSVGLPFFTPQQPMLHILYLTFPHSLHTLSSLATPRHLPVSIWKAAVPPLSFIIILLSALCLSPAQSDHSSRLVILFNIVSLGFTSISQPHSFRVFLQAIDSSISFTSVFDKPPTSFIFISCHYQYAQLLLYGPPWYIQYSGQRVLSQCRNTLAHMIAQRLPQ